VSLLPTTITYDPGFLTLSHDVSPLSIVVADYLGFRVLIRTSTVILVTGRSESWFETSIWCWFSDWVLPWLDASPLPPFLLDLLVVILESDCRVNQFLELCSPLVASSCKDSSLS
jgi:hypothetical protein